MFPYNAKLMNYIKNVNNIVIFFILVFASISISYTYYFDHLALVNSFILNNDEIYKDKTSLFFLIYSNSHPSFLSFIINFFIKIDFTTNFINMLLTFIATTMCFNNLMVYCKAISICHGTKR